LDVIGDQPGSLSNLIARAKLMGFNILVAGNMKRFLNRYATQKEMQSWADDKGLAVKQTVSFTDGTKQSIEMELLGNYFKMSTLKPNMTGHRVENVQEILGLIDWDLLPSHGVVDYIIGLKLFPGIFIVVEHPDPEQAKYLRYLGFGDGPRYVIFESFHLCHLEVFTSINKVLFFGQETINNSLTPCLKTYSTAKANLKKGLILDGIGGDDVYGTLDKTKNSQKYLPVGLSSGAKLKHSIQKDQPITFSDVELPQNTVTKLVLQNKISL